MDCSTGGTHTKLPPERTQINQSNQIRLNVSQEKKKCGASGGIALLLWLLFLVLSSPEAMPTKPEGGDLLLNQTTPSFPSVQTHAYVYFTLSCLPSQYARRLSRTLWCKYNMLLFA